MRQSRIDAGIKAKRDALFVALITPGLSEKLTGPITPRNPAMIFATPVNVIPLFIRLDIPVGFSIPCIDWMEPRSLIERAKKQNRKETRTPDSKDHLVIGPVRKNPANL